MNDPGAVGSTNPFVTDPAVTDPFVANPFVTDPAVEMFAATPTGAGIDVSTGAGTRHGDLNRPEEAAASIERFAARTHVPEST